MCNTSARRLRHTHKIQKDLEADSLFLRHMYTYVGFVRKEAQRKTRHTHTLTHSHTLFIVHMIQIDSVYVLLAVCNYLDTDMIYRPIQFVFFATYMIHFLRHNVHDYRQFASCPFDLRQNLASSIWGTHWPKRALFARFPLIRGNTW